jgi:ferredoxin
VKIVLDTGCCQGHGRCYDLAPALFDADDEGYAVLRTPDGHVQPDDVPQATRAVRSCPERALTLEGECRADSTDL